MTSSNASYTPSAIRAVIFDMGGVILRTDDPQPREALAQRFKLSGRELDEIVFNNPVAQQAESGQATLDEAWAESARLLGIPAEEIPTVRQQFFAGDRVDFELIDFIQRLRRRFTTMLLSNTWLVDLPRFLREDLQIPDSFDFIISSADVQMAKPDPRIFQRALNLAQVEPQQAIFVDDNEHNILAAAALGIYTVHFRGSDQARAAVLALTGPLE
jgi:glucose-1-phosphatase